ncbi:TPA: hypothetical protein ACGOVD_000303 [Streptococcus suis]
MKKSTKILILVLSIVIGGIAIRTNLFGVRDFLNQPIVTSQGKQIAYLKEHEQEIVDFVKSQNPKIESVQIDWEETQWEQIGNGTPQGAGWYIILTGTINHLSETEFSVEFYIEKKKDIPNIEDISLSDDIYIFKDGNWYVFE